MLRRMFSNVLPQTLAETFVALLIICFVGWQFGDLIRNELATRRGVADAQADIARGKLQYRLRGKPGPWEPHAVAITKREFGIEIVRTGGCVAGGSDWWYDVGYNRVLEDHLQQRFRVNPIAKAFETARE